MCGEKWTHAVMCVNGTVIRVVAAMESFVRIEAHRGVVATW